MPSKSAALEADSALFLDRRGLNGLHLALQTGEFRRLGIVAAHEEGGRPENDDGGRRGDRILGPLRVLGACSGGSRAADPLSLKAQFLAVVALVGDRRHIGRSDVLRAAGAAGGQERQGRGQSRKLGGVVHVKPRCNVTINPS